MQWIEEHCRAFEKVLYNGDTIIEAIILKTKLVYSSTFFGSLTSDCYTVAGIFTSD